MAVIVVEDIHQLSILLTFTIDDDTPEVNSSVVDVMVEHHQRKEVIGRTAKVGVENHLHGLFGRL